MLKVGGTVSQENLGRHAESLQLGLLESVHVKIVVNVAHLVQRHMYMQCVFLGSGRRRRRRQSAYLPHPQRKIRKVATRCPVATVPVRDGERRQDDQRRHDHGGYVLRIGTQVPAHRSLQQHDTAVPRKECRQFPQDRSKAVETLSRVGIQSVPVVVKCERPRVVVDQTGNHKGPQDGEIGGHKVPCGQKGAVLENAVNGQVPPFAPKFAG